MLLFGSIKFLYDRIKILMNRQRVVSTPWWPGVIMTERRGLPVTLAV